MTDGVRGRHPRTMSSSHHVASGRSTARTVLDDTPARHVAASDPRLTTARRWAAGGLAVSTVALLALIGPAAFVLAAILVGWCTGFAAVSVVVRHDAVAAPLAGLAGAVLGTCLGGALLAVQAGL